MSLEGHYARPQLQRDGDAFLMERLIIHFREYFTPKEMGDINKCRIYLRVLTLADIYECNGRLIYSKIKKGERNKLRTSIYNWPLQIKPGAREWRCWRKAIETAWTKGVHLGSWKRTRHQQFEWFWSPEYDRVHFKQGSFWEVFYKSASTRTTRERKHFISWGIDDDSIPDDILPTSLIERDGKHVYIEGSGHPPQPIVETPRIHFDHNWWISQDSKQHNDLSHLLKYTKIIVTKSELIRILEHDKLIIASDGSYHPTFKVGTAAVIIETSNGVSVGRGYCRTHGEDQDGNAYRSELMGILLGMTCLSEFISTTAHQPKAIDYGCGNETSIEKCLLSKKFHQAKLQHVDIIWPIQHIIHKHKLNVQGIHIPGHQTEEECNKNQYARMNAMAHDLANKFLSFCIQFKSDELAISQIPGNLWKIRLHDQDVVKDIEENIKKLFKMR